MKVKQTQLFTIAFNSNSPRTTAPINFNFSDINASSDLVELSITYALKSFKCKSVINSLNAIPFPDIPLTASQAETLVATLNLEWGNPRIQLDVMMNDGSGNYNSVGTISLINISPYPYRNFDLLSLTTDNDDITLSSADLGILITDVGYGFLGVGDSVNIWCEVEKTTYTHSVSQQSVNNISVPTPTINLNVEGSISSGDSSSGSNGFGTVGNCPGVTPPVQGSGQYFTFSSPVTDQEFNITVGGNVYIDPDEYGQNNGILVQLWSQQPSSSFAGKIEPPIARMGVDGGTFSVTSTAENQWMTVGIYYGYSGCYVNSFFFVSGNQIVVVAPTY